MPADERRLAGILFSHFAKTSVTRPSKTRSEKHQSLPLPGGNGSSVALPLILGESRANRKLPHYPCLQAGICLNLRCRPEGSRYDCVSHTGSLTESSRRILPLNFRCAQISFCDKAAKVAQGSIRQKTGRSRPTHFWDSHRG